MMLRKMNGPPSAETICLSDGSWTDLAPPNQILRLHLVVIKQREESFPVSVILRRSLVEAPLCIRWLGKIEIHVPALLESVHCEERSPAHSTLVTCRIDSSVHKFGRLVPNTLEALHGKGVLTVLVFI
jgi:hypothetical protein